MQTATLEVVEDTPEVLKMRFEREWKSIEQEKQGGQIDYDVKRAQLLKIYHGEVMTQREMAARAEISQAYVNNLLRYARFHEFMISREIINKMNIAEKTFRRYWATTVDKSTIALLGGNGRGAKNNPAILNYEQEVFLQIIDKVEKGVMPTKPVTSPKKTMENLSPELLKEFRKEMKTFTAIKRKEVQDIYKRIEVDILELIQLSGKSRSTYAPGPMAMHAKRLREGLIDLQRILKGDVDDWILSAL